VLILLVEEANHPPLEPGLQNLPASIGRFGGRR
jgi:hypothetical protein